MTEHRRLLPGLFLVLAAVCVYHVVFSLGSSLALFSDRSSDGIAIEADLLQPPTNLQAPASGTDPIPLSWSASPDASYIDGYRVYRRLVGSGTWAQINQTVGLTYNQPLADLTVTSNYEFMVRAYFQNWQSLESNIIECEADTATTYDCSNPP